MGRMAVNPLAAAVVSRAVSIVPRRRRRYIMESDPGPTDRPMDQARAEKGREGGTENTDVNCIPSRGKKSILFGIRNERGNERGQVLPRESNHRRTQLAMQVIFVAGAVTTRVSSIISRRAEFENRHFDSNVDVDVVCGAGE